MSDTEIKRLGQFGVGMGRCESPLHTPELGGGSELCVRIGGIEVCADCVQEYHLDFAEAVEVWHWEHGHA